MARLPEPDRRDRAGSGRAELNGGGGASGGPGVGDLPGRDRDLIDRCLDHEPGAWEEFLQQYGRLIYSTIHRVGLPADEQGDAFQSSVMAIYLHLGDLRDRCRLISWIVGITWRQSVDRIRSRAREVRMEAVEDSVLRASLDPAVDAPPPDRDRIALEEAQHAKEAIASLSGRCARLISLMFYEQPPLDYAEIARREGIPIGSLGPTRARCLEKLRQFFRKRGWTV